MLRRSTPAPVVAARVREVLRAHSGDDLVAAPPAADQTVSRWQRLASRIPVRLDPGRKAAIGVGLAVVAAALVTGLWLLAQRPRAVPLPAANSGIAGAASPVGSRVAPLVSSSAPSVQVVVDVAGKVHRPGLYRLPAGARVDDAVRRAGGALAGVDLTSLNLAAKVVDGQQIVVGAAGVASGPGGAAGAGSALVNLNSATLDQLEGLPGVGPVLAQHILDWRTQHGSFGSVDQLDDVPGIGAVKFAALRSLVTV